MEVENTEKEIVTEKHEAKKMKTEDTKTEEKNVVKESEENKMEVDTKTEEEENIQESEKQEETSNMDEDELVEPPQMKQESSWGDDDDDDGDGDGWDDEDNATNTKVEESDDEWGNLEDMENENQDDEIIKEAEVVEKEEWYIVLSEDTVRKEMEKRVNSLVENGIGENVDEARQILQYYKWNPGKAMEKYWETSEKTRIACGVDKTPGSDPYEDEDECEICMDEFNEKKWKKNKFGLGCGHFFCVDCWMHNLFNAGKKFQCISLSCPESTCKFAVTKTRLAPLEKMKNVNKEDIQKFATKVDMFALNNFVECNSYYKFCPGKGCTNIVQMKNGALRDCYCDCGHGFCYHCSSDVHEPAPCKVAKAWNDRNAGKNDDDFKWIILNSKKCPGCGHYIQRNQGCNHMTCRHPTCGHEFCWMCLADWKTHGGATGGYYKCNIYEGKKSRFCNI